MPTQEAKAHHVGEWASLRNTSPEIAEAIFEVAGYDEKKKMAEKIWEEGSDEVLVKAFAKTDKDSLFFFWGEQTIERKKTFNQRLPASRGEFSVISPLHSTRYQTYPSGRNHQRLSGNRLIPASHAAQVPAGLTHRHYVTVPHSDTHIQFSSNRDWLCCHANAGKRFCRQSACVRSGHATDTV